VQGIRVCLTHQNFDVVRPGPSDGSREGPSVGVADDHRRVGSTTGNAEVVEHGQGVAEQLGEGVALHFVRRRRKSVAKQVRRDHLIAEAGEVGQLVLPAIG